MHLSVLLSLLPLALSAPVLTPRAGQVIPGKYVVKLKASAGQDQLNEALAKLSSAPDHRYTFGDFKGFAAGLSDDTVNQLTAMDAVEYVEKDAVVHTNTYVSEENAPWGLGRISHIANGSTTYVYDDSAGEGTCAYVIDTGIFIDHPEFEGRATWLANFADSDDTDGYGHGTHVAGTIGSKTYGVAKKTSLYAVKVLDSSGGGAWSGVLAGIQYAANDSTTRDCPKGSVANMSLGGAKTQSINDAVAAGVQAGLFFAVSAGNDNTDAANQSPASEPSACTVGATDSSDTRASFSNYGALVDIFAPGVDVLSTWNNGGTNTISGTSMASPHITGLGAYLLALEGSYTPAALCSRIQELGSKGEIMGVPSGTVNDLAFNGNPSG